MTHDNEYLVNVPESAVTELSPQEAYDRQRLLTKREVSLYLKELGYISHHLRDEPKERYQKDRPTKVYKNWTND